MTKTRVRAARLVLLGVAASGTLAGCGGVGFGGGTPHASDVPPLVQPRLGAQRAPTLDETLTGRAGPTPEGTGAPPGAPRPLLGEAPASAETDAAPQGAGEEGPPRLFPEAGAPATDGPPRLFATGGLSPAPEDGRSGGRRAPPRADAARDRVELAALREALPPPDADLADALEADRPAPRPRRGGAGPQIAALPPPDAPPDSPPDAPPTPRRAVPLSLPAPAPRPAPAPPPGRAAPRPSVAPSVAPSVTLVAGELVYPDETAASATGADAALAAAASLWRRTGGTLTLRGTATPDPAGEPVAALMAALDRGRRRAEAAAAALRAAGVPATALVVEAGTDPPPRPGRADGFVEILLAF